MRKILILRRNLYIGTVPLKKREVKSNNLCEDYMKVSNQKKLKIAQTIPSPEELQTMWLHNANLAAEEACQGTEEPICTFCPLSALCKTEEWAECRIPKDLVLDFYQRMLLPVLQLDRHN